MHPAIVRSFGGLTPQYYFRNLFFGILCFTFFIWMMLQREMRDVPNAGTVTFITITLLTVNTLLYPYARFIYERMIGFIVGQNEFFVPALRMLIVKFLTMGLCWGGAIFIAPLGLVYLYFFSGRTER